MKRFAHPDDIAPAMAFLMGPEANFITGQTLAVDGGMSHVHPHAAEDQAPAATTKSGPSSPGRGGPNSSADPTSPGEPWPGGYGY